MSEKSFPTIMNPTYRRVHGDFVSKFLFAKSVHRVQTCMTGCILDLSFYWASMYNGGSSIGLEECK